MSAADRTIPKDTVTVLFASALGQEKSDEIVLATARGLGIPGTLWSGLEVRTIFEKLAKTEGLVGVVARFAISRGDLDRIVVEATPSSSRRLDAFGAAEPPTLVKREAIDLLPLLAPALGAEKARDATEAAARRLGIDIKNLTQETAIAVLDELTCTEGIVGVVARFAKARFLLAAT